MTESINESVTDKAVYTNHKEKNHYTQTQINNLSCESNTISNKPVEHQNPHNNSPTSKNEYLAQNTRQGSSAEISEMKTFIGTVMQTLQDFHKKLTVQ